MYNPIYLDQSQGMHPMANDVKTVCQKYMKYHVIAHTANGSQFDAIIDDIDADGVTMLVPEELNAHREDEQEYRQFGFGGNTFRRYHRRRFPFQTFVFPFFVPYPYYSPYYFYPPYPTYPAYPWFG
ncbi:hypothetical protein [Paenibacillus silviterrae]|uniref:hypothetical protein n=1 Tax=Paenibacillus silviterrae TaxID=3242194 RepID=UPI0025427CA8|nr:hypothetical protein [Paenibacillus chinjuensis]